MRFCEEMFRNNFYEHDSAGRNLLDDAKIDGYRVGQIREKLSRSYDSEEMKEIREYRVPEKY